MLRNTLRRTSAPEHAQEQKNFSIRGPTCKGTIVTISRIRNNVDFGLWKSIPKSKLSCPLDTHTLRISQKLELVKRKTNDLLTLNELDKSLRSFDQEDPVKYDFALFGLGVENEF